MNACMMTIANTIKKLRREHGLTQEDLAAKAGVGLATIQRAESGKRLSADTLASIAAAFCMPASELAQDNAISREPYLPLEPIVSGRSLVALVLGIRRIDFGFCELDNLDDAKTIEAFHDFCHAVGALDGPLSPIALVSRELEARDHLAALTTQGFCVGGAQFEITAYEIDDDFGNGPPVLFAQWDDHCVALRVGRTSDEIASAPVMRALGKWETPKGGNVIFPSTNESAIDFEAPSDAPITDAEEA